MAAVAHPAAAVGVAALARRLLRKGQGQTTVTVTRVIGADGQVVDVAPDTVVVTSGGEQVNGDDRVLLAFGVFIGSWTLFAGWLLRQARKRVEELQADVDELRKQPP